MDYVAAASPGAVAGAAVVAAAVPGPLAALRAQMGLSPVPDATPATPPRGAGWHLAGLATLGQELLGAHGGSGGAAEPGLGAEVLVSAARQRLMAVPTDKMRIGHLELLAADYASLAGMELERRALDRCAD